MPTVTYIGNFGAEHSTENDVRRAFEHLGWSVRWVEERDFLAQLDGGRRARSPFLDLATSSDLVLHTMTQGSYGDLSWLWDACRGAKVPTASIHLDLFYGLSSPKDSGPQRCDLPAVHPMFRCDHVFTADGGHDLEFERDGVNHHWLPPGVRHDHAKRIRPSHDVHVDPRWYGIEVAFVGSRGYHPEWPHRPELVDRLREWYGPRFAHVGGGADADLHGATGGAMRGLELNAFYDTVPVIVGDYCFARWDSRYWSDRWPETWGRGGFLLYPRTAPLDDLVGYNAPCWEVGEWDQLHQRIDYFLTHPEIREGVTAMVQPDVAANHTYVNRVTTMLDTIGAGQ